MTFVHRHRVRYHETDNQRIVFNARYWEYLDVAMAEYFRWLGWDYPQLIVAGMDPAVVHAEMSFQQPAALDDELGIAVSCVKLGHTSFEMAYRVTRSGESGAGEEPIARARIVYVNFDPESRRKRPVPDVFRAPLLESQGTAVKPREDR